MTHWLSFLTDCADIADAIALRYFRNRDLAVTTKSNETPVTQADTEIEQAIRSVCAMHYPMMAIYGEEFGTCAPDAPVKLYIDPIDATQNFMRGIPVFATLLAVEERGEIVCGMVSAPGTRDRWWAIKGGGAFHNGDGIRVSETTQLASSFALHGSLYGRECSGTPAQLQAVLKQTFRQRGFGDYWMHCLVAQGQADLALDFGLAPWDKAPLTVIVSEAGGQWFDRNGAMDLASGDMICCNGQLKGSILKFLQNTSD